MKEKKRTRTRVPVRFAAVINIHGETLSVNPDFALGSVVRLAP